MSIRSIGLYLVIVAGSVLAGTLGFEIYMRHTLLKKVPERVKGAAMWIQNHTLTPGPADEYFGRGVATHPRGLFKVDTAIDIAVIHPTAGVLNFSVRTNNVGLLSDNTYALDRDPAVPEYRIAVLGDSMTGTTTATYQWVDTVEELLNSSDKLRHIVGNKQFKLYNIGWVGAGFNTFWLAYDRSAKYFAPDLVVINYIDIDFPRNAAGAFTDEERITEHAKEHVGKILDAHPKTIAALMPTYNELMTGKYDVDRTERLMKAVPRLTVEIMHKRLPTQLGKQEIEKWYSIPHDAHLSDRGGEVYARALAGWIAEKIGSGAHDFSKTPTKYWDLDPSAPRVRKIKNTLSHITDNPPTLAQIKATILEDELRGKVYSMYPYTFHPGIDGMTIPYDRPVIGGFQKIPFGPGKDDVVFLFISCTSKPITLHNAECYHFQHVFAK